MPEPSARLRVCRGLGSFFGVCCHRGGLDATWANVGDLWANRPVCYVGHGQIFLPTATALPLSRPSQRIARRIVR